MASFRDWYSQVTTGIGALVGAPATIAILSGQVTWQHGLPALVAAVIGLAWPENKQVAQAGSTVTADIERAFPLALALAKHIAAQVAVASAPAPTPTPATVLAPAAVVVAAPAPAPVAA